jgi:peptide deformylase
MAKLRIVKFGDPMLRKTARPVEEITPRIITLLDDMIETMREAGGCGLAAPQVGVLRRIAVIEVVEGEVIELINPKIIAFSGEQNEQEGCLSNPGEYGVTKRPANVTVRATDRHGKEFEVTGSELLARAICHECDHLDGKLYTDVQIRALTEKDFRR